jgi:mRNA-degrading endonuclease RelE of RelBE toxin-antitoxin system
MSNIEHSWPAFYIEFASALLSYKNNRGKLMEKVNSAFATAAKRNSNINNGLIHLSDVDPFTIFGTFNRGLSAENRNIITDSFKKEFELDSNIPSDTDGIPILNNLNSTLINNANGIAGNEINQLWDCFEYAIKYADSEDKNSELFEKYFNLVLTQKGVKWNITMGLFWIRPYTFMTLDSTFREYCRKYTNSDVHKKIGSLKNVPEGKEYLKYCKELIEYYPSTKDLRNHVDVSHRAYVVGLDPYWPNKIEYDPKITKEDWIEYFKDKRVFKDATWYMLKAFKEVGFESTSSNLHEKYGRGKTYYTMIGTSLAIDLVTYKSIPHAFDLDDVKYWPIVFQGRYVEEYNKKRYSWRVRKELVEALNTIDFGKINLDDPDKSMNYWWLITNPEIKSFNSLKVEESIEYKLFNEDGSKIRLYENFLKARVGDLVIGYEIKPTKKIVALLTVDKVNLDYSVVFRKTEDLIYPVDRSQLEDSIKVFKEMQIYKDAGGPLIQLSEKEYTQLMELITQISNPPVPENYPKYSKEDFLNDVYMDEEKYEVLKSLLLRKKNVILLGAPGTGKTYVAKRLAFSIIGQKNENRVQMVQFHQNFAYEDFIEGYRPVDGKFELESGIFKNFVLKQAMILRMNISLL